MINDWNYRRLICGRRWCEVDAYTNAPILALQQAHIARGEWAGVALLAGLANGYLRERRA